jgi:mannitol-specific phosphotransferase system IIBC component
VVVLGVLPALRLRCKYVKMLVCRVLRRENGKDNVKDKKEDKKEKKKEEKRKEEKKHKRKMKEKNQTKRERIPFIMDIGHQNPWADRKEELS